MKTISDLYECAENKLGESLIARCKQLKESSSTYEIPDLIHLAKQDSSKDIIEPIGFYHHCVGIDFSKGTPSIAAYFGKLLSNQQKKSRISFNRAKWAIVAGTYCTYDPISKIDLRVSFSLPGTFNLRWIKLKKGLQKEEEIQPKNKDLLWKYLSLASFIRSWCLKPDFIKYPSLVVNYELDPFNYQNLHNIIKFEKKNKKKVKEKSKQKNKENENENEKEKEKKEEKPKKGNNKKNDKEEKQKQKLKALELIYQSQSQKLNECFKIARNQLIKGVGKELSHKNPKLLPTNSNNLLTYALQSFFNRNCLYQKGENFFLQFLQYDWEYSSLISKCMRKNGKIKQALKLLLESNSRIPESIPILKEIVKCYNLLEDNIESFSYARKIHHLIPFSPKSWKILANEFLNQKKYNQAFEILNLIPRDNNDNPFKSNFHLNQNYSSKVISLLDFYNLTFLEKNIFNKNFPKPIEITQPIKTNWTYDWKKIVLKMKRVSNISYTLSKLKSEPIKGNQKEIAFKAIIEMFSILGWSMLSSEKRKFFNEKKELKKKELVLNQFRINDLKLTDQMWDEWLNYQDHCHDDLENFYTKNIFINENKHYFDVNYENIGKSYKEELRKTGVLPFSKDIELNQINLKGDEIKNGKEKGKGKERVSGEEEEKKIEKENEKEKEKEKENENEKESQNKKEMEEKKEIKNENNNDNENENEKENKTEEKFDQVNEKNTSQLTKQTSQAQEDLSGMNEWSGSSPFELIDNDQKINRSTNGNESENNKQEQNEVNKTKNNDEKIEKIETKKKVQKEITFAKESSFADFSNFKAKSEFSSLQEAEIPQEKETIEKENWKIGKEKGSNQKCKITKHNLSNNLILKQINKSNEISDFGYFGASESEGKSESDLNNKKNKSSSINDLKEIKNERKKEKENTKEQESEEEKERKKGKGKEKGKEKGKGKGKGKGKEKGKEKEKEKKNEKNKKVQREKINLKFAKSSNEKNFIYNTYPKAWLKKVFKNFKKKFKVYNKISIKNNPNRWEENNLKKTPRNEWEMIGDLCKKLNKLKEAKQAYSNAILEPKNKDLLHYCITFKLLRLLDESGGIVKALQVCNSLIGYESCEQKSQELSLLFKHQIWSSIFKLIHKHGWSNLNKHIQLHKNNFHQSLKDFILIAKYLKVDGYDR
ncbi:bud site selection protein 7-related [Anaeramoeba flamelloides]|uniref:Bud site selection protein 7-related n=1 Tax=Anaeramoeba flamelloides TaxID=1746091 RepID=A0AAV7YWA9_9EUKA|nr:bud site selection protein 7-related [Anaeramoeba flamelloides]